LIRAYQNAIKNFWMKSNIILSFVATHIKT
jgi:hypothetical protein